MAPMKRGTLEKRLNLRIPAEMYHKLERIAETEETRLGTPLGVSWAARFLLEHALADRTENHDDD